MRILVVEDEIGIANFLQQGLEEEAYAVDVCHHGDQALDLALSGQYDLFLLDWMLPGKSGLELCKLIRQEGILKPVIFLTAKDRVAETVEALESGADDYIKKPFHFDELLARIQARTRKKEAAVKTLRLGPIKLEPESFRCWKGKQEVKLTQKEFALLEFLIENKEQACTRKEIIEKVWDIHFDYPTGVIDVYINALRKKLDLAKDENYIQTIRGVGYIAKEI